MLESKRLAFLKLFSVVIYCYADFFIGFSFHYVDVYV
jgi:hypothetical protein